MHARIPDIAYMSFIRQYTSHYISIYIYLIFSLGQVPLNIPYFILHYNYQYFEIHSIIDLKLCQGLCSDLNLLQPGVMLGFQNFKTPNLKVLGWSSASAD